MINRLSFLAVGVIALAVHSSAATPLQIGQTYDSGYTGTTELAVGAGDNDFTLYGPNFAISTPVVAGPIPGAWVPDSNIGLWISPTENQTYPSNVPEGDAPGLYDYDAQLSTNFLVPTSITISGSFAADNAVSLYIDGTQVTSVAAPAYGSLTSFSYTFTLTHTGSYSVPIDFIVTNLDDVNGAVNPTGLFVSGLKAVATSAPEPSTWAMLFAGIAGLLVVRRVRRASLL